MNPGICVCKRRRYCASDDETERLGIGVKASTVDGNEDVMDVDQTARLGFGMVVSTDAGEKM